MPLRTAPSTAQKTGWWRSGRIKLSVGLDLKAVLVAMATRTAKLLTPTVFKLLKRVLPATPSSVFQRMKGKS
ncbi:predicted protein [Chaetomium globosum CBS 148.51]|uniref:Uncharacterized protein n=1 Tax=Chaetomium globosum (strain ATCC 6205 / CBS 148.51 / DSM 1962 / NBRC 6347 / NRRL 1970) TaxID=306901 RepID=Q2H222_CHAGB|nr:uncharacterized protein CHGG_04174 [Chaetomium globosum CBS 148.51]EAQ87555.1 predicted protein [Chaetomium globosum CBS 148.51]